MAEKVSDISVDGEMIALACQDGQIKIFRNVWLKKSLINDSPCTSCCFNPSDSQIIASGHQSGILFVWDTVDRSQVAKGKIGPYPLDRVRYVPSDSKYLFCLVTQSQLVIKVESSSLQQLAQVMMPGVRLFSIGDTFLAMSDGQEIVVHNHSKMKRLCEITFSDLSVTAIEWTQSGALLVGDSTGGVNLIT